MNKEADLRAALQCPSNSSSASSLNLAAPGGPSFQGRQSSSIVLMSSLIALCQGGDSARETTRPVWVSQMFPRCWAAVSGLIHSWGSRLPHRRRVYTGTGRGDGHLGV